MVTGCLSRPVAGSQYCADHQNLICKGKNGIDLNKAGYMARPDFSDFFSEPVGLAPHHLTEPERKTMSPVKMLFQILQSYQPRFV